MIILALSLFFAVMVAVAASKRGRSGFKWFVLSFFFGPIIIFIVLLCMKDLNCDY